MEKLKTSVVAKILSYSILPVCCILIILSTIGIVYYIEFPEIKDNKNYYESTIFSRKYQYEVDSIMSIMKSYKKNNKKLSENLKDINYNSRFVYNDNIDILIIDNDNKAYTNLEKTYSTDTIDKIIKEIEQSGEFWIYENETINTSIENLSLDNIKYSNLLEEAKEGNYKIYSRLKRDNYQFNLEKFLYEKVSKYIHSCYAIFLVNIFFASIIIIYLFISVGHKKGYNGIYMNFFDKISLEIVTIIMSIAIIIECSIISLILSNTETMINSGLILCLPVFIMIYISTVIYIATFVKRIKSKTLLKNTLTYKCYKYINNKMKKIIKYVVYDRNSTIRYGFIYILFICISIILSIMTATTGIAIIALIGFWIWCFSKLMKKINEFKQIKKVVKEIYEGNSEVTLDENELTGELKELAGYINDISGGFANAIEKGIKSEKLKTELITNVSHDIKTPLTSIINYIDLLKKEELNNQKVQEYLEVLDSKSQRLKKLTEDLIEASKASSGNIKLNIEKLNAKELISQVIGEFKDKFNKKQLDIITNVPNNDIYIYADGRYLYRVFENLFSNISKYALEKSRVYVDVKVEKEKVKIILKNISKEKLNISEEELMQRFVRGEESRTTEGSGLGISIAKSLTELQNGEFKMYVDGDLFKVELEFKTYKV